MSVPGVYNLEASLAAARQEAEPVVEEPPVTRRAVLRAAGAAAAGFILGTGTEEYTDGLPSQLLFSPDTESLPTGMPPELQGKNIDRTNEHYQPDFSKVVEAGVDAYKANGGKPFYKRPDFYISEWDAVKEKIHGYFGSSNGLAVQRDNNTPYQRFMNFSINNATFPQDLYDYDPGSSARPVIAQRIQAMGAAANKPLSGDNNASELTVSDAVIMDGYRQNFHDALTHIDTARKNGQVSTAELYTYYLEHNNGDMVTSLIDTVTFLKLAARIDVSVLSGKIPPFAIFNPTRANAELVAERFYDDFSASLPLNKLLQSVPANSDFNNFDQTVHTQISKNYDPVNRAGMPYHIWNIISLVACSHPSAAQEMIESYYMSSENGRDTKPAQGSIKIETDMRAVKQAHQIRAVFEHYAVD